MSPPAIQAAIEALVSALDDLSIPYFIGGSVASSVHGNPRSTLDADIVARLSPEHVEPLVARFGDREMVRWREGGWRATTEEGSALCPIYPPSAPETAGDQVR